MRIWFKLWKDARMLRDFTVENAEEDTRTHKIFHAIDRACMEFDLSHPQWLEKTVNEFRKHGKARFYQDNFMDDIEFDFMEMEVLEDDY